MKHNHFAFDQVAPEDILQRGNDFGDVHLGDGVFPSLNLGVDFPDELVFANSVHLYLLS